MGVLSILFKYYNVIYKFNAILVYITTNFFMEFKRKYTKITS